MPKNGKNVYTHQILCRHYRTHIALLSSALVLSLSPHICTRWIALKLSRRNIHDNSNIQLTHTVRTSCDEKIRLNTIIKIEKREK